MKTTKRFLLAAATLVLAACAKETFTEETAQDRVSVRVEVPGTPDVKSYLTDDYHICWEADKDELSFFYKTTNCKFTAKKTGVSTCLEGELPTDASGWIYAVYPYDPDATNSTGTVTTVLPSLQKAIPNQYSNIVAAGATKVSGSGASMQLTPLRLQACVTLVEVDLRIDGAIAINVEGNNGELLSGDLRMKCPTADDQNPSPVIVNGKNYVTLADGGNVLAQGKYYIAIAPQTFTKGLTITVMGYDMNCLFKGTTKENKAVRGKRLVAGTLEGSLPTLDPEFYLAFGDKKQTSMVMAGAERDFIYSYSGTSFFIYGLKSSSPVKTEYFVNGSTTPVGYEGILTKDFEPTPDANSFPCVSLLPVTESSGGENENVSRLRAATPKGTKDSPVNLSQDNSTLFGLSGVNTANCYIVSAAGWYSFPLVYGNAIKNGVANTAAYSPAAGSTAVLSPFVDAYGDAITQPYINAGAHKAVSATLEWQDALGIIDDDVILRDADSPQGASVLFHVPSETLREGNALISVRDEQDHILWSWHIWVSGASDSDLRETVAVTNKNGKSYRFMKINLGWVAPFTTPISYTGRETLVRITQTGTGKVISFKFVQLPGSIPANELGNCPFYQWGRKDPFPASAGIPCEATDNAQKKIWYNDARIDTVGTRVKRLGTSLAQFISNPVCYNMDSNGDNQYCNLWNAAQTAFYTPAGNANNENQPVKTIYDPCPAGMCVPPIGAHTGFTKDNTTGGFDNGYTFFANPDKTGGQIYFPATGSMSTSNATATMEYASVRNVGTGFSYWSANPNAPNSAFYVNCYNKGAVNATYGSYRQYVYPIRPIKE